MKNLFEIQLEDIRGKTLTGADGKPVLAGNVVLEVILMETKEDQNGQDIGANKLARFDLARRCAAGDDLSDDDKSFIRARAARVCSALVYARLLEIL